MSNNQNLNPNLAALGKNHKHEEENGNERN